MTGQFHPLKGHLDFLAAAQSVLRNVTDRRSVFFIIIGARFSRDALWKRPIKFVLGKPDYVKAVHTYMKRHSLEKNFRLVPFTLDILSIMSEVDVFVRPAITGDPWGRDIIEAMALGKPVVATGESEFYILHGETGFLVPPRNPKKLARRIAELIKNPDLRQRLGAAGARRIWQMCDLNDYGRKVHQIYEGLMNDSTAN